MGVRVIYTDPSGKKHHARIDALRNDAFADLKAEIPDKIVEIEFSPINTKKVKLQDLEIDNTMS